MKNFLFAILVIIVITIVFLFFSDDINEKNKRFLTGFGLETDANPVSFEEIRIPESFDSVYQDYNAMQIASGFDLSRYKGKKAVRYTYRLLNFPSGGNVFANVICVKGKPVAGDICCPELSGFILPLNYLR